MFQIWIGEQFFPFFENVVHGSYNQTYIFKPWTFSNSLDVHKLYSISVPLISCFHADGHDSFYYLKKFLKSVKDSDGFYNDENSEAIKLT